jgi:hypothetical protein
MPVIPAVWEIRRLEFEGSPDKRVNEIQNLKKKLLAGHQWLMPVILPT